MFVVDIGILVVLEANCSFVVVVCFLVVVVCSSFVVVSCFLVVVV